MTHNLTAIDPTILAVIKGSFGKDGIPMPFVTEIFLMECHVAGTTYIDLTDIEPKLVADAPLVFKREPNNPHDSLAIQIYSEQGDRIGYVPKAKNEVLARLMDAGKLIFGKLISKGWEGYDGKWLKLQIKAYMRDL